MRLAPKKTDTFRNLVRYLVVLALLALVAVMLASTSLFAQSILVPMPSPLTAVSSSGSGSSATAVTGSGTAGQVAFWNGTQTITGDAGFTYSATTGLILNESGLATFDIRLESDTNTNALFFDGTGAGLFGFWNGAPTHKIDITPGTLLDASSGMKITATQPSGGASFTPTLWVATTGAGSGATSQASIYAPLGAGYSGSGDSYGVATSNSSTSTGTWHPTITSVANTAATAKYAVWALTNGAATGTSVGARFYARASSTINVAVQGSTDDSPSGVDTLDFGVVGNSNSVLAVAGRHVGVGGFAVGGQHNIGGYFGLTVAEGAAMSFALSGAIVANNGAVAAPIFVGLDNGTAVFTIGDNAAFSAGTTTANVWTSNVVATGGADTAWRFEIPAGYVAADTAYSFRGSGGGTLASIDGTGFFLAAGVSTGGGTNGTGPLYATRINNENTAAGFNARFWSAANAVGEYSVSLGTSAALAAATLDTQLLGIGYGIASTATYVWEVNGAGHVKHSGIAMGSVTSGSCTSETVSGNDSTGAITTTCGAGDTTIATFGRAYIGTVDCQLTPGNAAAAAVTLGMAHVSTSTTALTITHPTGVTAGIYIYECSER